MKNIFQIKGIQFHVANALFTANKLIRLCKLQMKKISIDTCGRMVIHLHARSDESLPAMEFVIIERADEEADELNFMIDSDEFMYPDLLYTINSLGLQLGYFKMYNATAGGYNPICDFIDVGELVGFIIHNYDFMESNVTHELNYSEPTRVCSNPTDWDQYYYLQERRTNQIQIQANNPKIYYDVFKKLGFALSEDSTPENFTVQEVFSKDYAFYINVSKASEVVNADNLFDNILIKVDEVETDMHYIEMHV
ncbi:MAG: hypothetical protein JST29_01520 [Bacteroidetes bacterium]|nr:hypothetical protein [Bacteroidota bacterium]